MLKHCHIILIHIVLIQSSCFLMPIRSGLSTGIEKAPLERIERIKDIAASRKEELGKHGHDIRQQALERSTKNNENRINRKSSKAEIRGHKKKAFAEEFSKMGCLRCSDDEDFNKVNDRTGINGGRSEEESKGHHLKQPAHQPAKPRWNSGTSTSQITASNHLYGDHDPFLKNFLDKHTAFGKGKGVNKSQSRPKPSPKEKSVQNEIPVIKLSIVENKGNKTNIDKGNIPRYVSEPVMTKPISSKRCAPSSKIHNEKCGVIRAKSPDTPFENENTDLYVFAAGKYRKLETLPAVKDKMCIETKDEKSSRVQEKKVPSSKPMKNAKMVEVKEDADCNTMKPKPFKSGIPILNRTNTTINSSLGLRHSRYFRDNRCDSHVALKTMSKSETEQEGNYPDRSSETNKCKVKIPTKQKLGTARQRQFIV